MAINRPDGGSFWLACRKRSVPRTGTDMNFFRRGLRPVPAETISDSRIVLSGLRNVATTIANPMLTGSEWYARAAATTAEHEPAVPAAGTGETAAAISGPN
eukprot:2113816-Amphidinium_carterae.1